STKSPVWAIRWAGRCPANAPMRRCRTPAGGLCRPPRPVIRPTWSPRPPSTRRPRPSPAVSAAPHRTGPERIEVTAEQREAARTDSAWYVYGIVPADVETAADVRGVAGRRVQL